MDTDPGTLRVRAEAKRANAARYRAAIATARTEARGEALRRGAAELLEAAIALEVEANRVEEQDGNAHAPQVMPASGRMA